MSNNIVTMVQNVERVELTPVTDCGGTEVRPNTYTTQEIILHLKGGDTYNIDVFFAVREDEP